MEMAVPGILIGGITGTAILIRMQGGDLERET